MSAIIYLRHEPTRDNASGKQDVVAFKATLDGFVAVARWPWHLSTKPDRAAKRVTINCSDYAPVWLDHMGRPEPVVACIAYVESLRDAEPAGSQRREWLHRLLGNLRKV